MGRVRTKTVKRAARQIVEKFYGKLTMDFQINKKIAEEVAMIPSKRLRNKIAGYVTHLMRRIQTRPVRGISLKLQEEERERRMDFVPEKSEFAVDGPVVVSEEVKNMLNALNVRIPMLQLETPGAQGGSAQTPAIPGATGLRNRY